MNSYYYNVTVVKIQRGPFEALFIRDTGERGDFFAKEVK